MHDNHARTIGDMQGLPVSEWGNEEVLDGVQFLATLQLRTPFRIVSRHREHFRGPGIPPNIATELWHGMWVQKTKTWKQLGIDLPELTPGAVATDIGVIPDGGGEYLHFLLAIRPIVERYESVEARRNDLAIEVANPRWSDFVEKHGGSWAVANKFFPRFIDILPGLHSDAVVTLLERQLNTPAALIGASDLELLAVKGIGAARLKKIREVCADSLNPTSEYVELVGR